MGQYACRHRHRADTCSKELRSEIGMERRVSCCDSET